MRKIRLFDNVLFVCFLEEFRGSINFKNRLLYFVLTVKEPPNPGSFR